MIRRLWLRGRPAETRFFLFLGAFGLVLAAIYWLLTYELAGTVLLGGFGLGAAVVGLRLLADPRGARLGTGDGAATATPFVDERGRLPGETFAPLSLGLGLALVLTAVVFGPWLVIAGVVPLAWGAGTWLRGAREELDATVAADGRNTAPAPDAIAAGPGEG